MNPAPVTEAELHAYIDGVLPLARHEEVEAYLAARPAEMERVQAYRRQKEELRALFHPVLDEPIPIRLARRSHASAWSWGHLVAGLAIAIVSGGSGWFLHGQADPGLATASARNETSAFVRQAAIAHVVYSPEVRRPVEVGADQEEQLVTWLSKRIGAPVRAPKLAAAGFELIGGRLLPGNSGPVAQFMYQDASGQRLTLYVSTDHAVNRDTGFRFAQEGRVNVFYWIDGKFGYALSGGIGKDALTRVATLVYEQLEAS
jgi:anti-sigma factor RsiW